MQYGFLRLQPVLKNYIWGGVKLAENYGRFSEQPTIAESWELSVHADGQSDLPALGMSLTDYLAIHKDALGKNSQGYMPILVKFIDSADNLSIQVHPNDTYARAVENDNGKTEMWYIMDAKEGAGIYCGLKHALSSNEFAARIADGTILDVLNFIPVQRGDAYLIEAGTLHAIGKDLTICEVQQSSNVTYRVYDYQRVGQNGKPRELHIEKAKAVTNLTAFVDHTNCGTTISTEFGTMRLLTSSPYFVVEEFVFQGEGNLPYRADSFMSIHVVQGEGVISSVDTSDADISRQQKTNINETKHTITYVNHEKFVRGDSFFIPAKSSIKISGECTMVVTSIPGQKVYVGIDLGGTNIKAGLCGIDGTIFAKLSIKTGKDRPFEQIAEDMANLAKKSAQAAGIDFSEVAGIGIGAPGSVDSHNGVIVYSNNIRWDNVPLGSTLARLTGKKVFVTNDANAAALGEARYGAGKGYRNSVLFTLGTGVGGGIIIDGQLFEGFRSAGAEVGHMVIMENGEPCTCGRKGCLEAYASATGLIRDTRRAMEEHRESAMWKIVNGDLEQVDGRTAFAAARKGCGYAQGVVNAYIQHLAEGIINIVNILRPEVVIVGGGVCNEGDALMKPLEIAVEKEVYGGTNYAPVKLVRATLSNDAGIVGAIAFAADQMECL